MGYKKLQGLQEVESGKRGYWRLLGVTGGVIVSLRG